MSVTKEKRKVSVHSGAQQPQSVKGKSSTPGAQQPQAYGNGEIVTVALKVLWSSIHSDAFVP